jgi:ubiquinone/menaquinone biosynthesis C-methylase UbiE
MSDEQASSMKHVYDAVAQSYSRSLSGVEFEDPLDLAMIDYFVSLLKPGARALDAGCGAGRMLTYLNTRDPSLTVAGVDYSAGMVAEAQASHPTVPVVVGDLANLPHQDAAFDAILAWYSIIHTPPQELQVVFAELHRVLAPGGLLLCAYHAGDGERVNKRPYGHDEVELRTILHPTPDVIADLDRVGFSVRARLDRTARPTENNDQGFVLVERR